MMAVKKTTLTIFGGMLAAGLLGNSVVTADESVKEPVMAPEDNPDYVPIDGGGHSWTYVKTTYTSTGYIKLYSDTDSYWYYTKEVFYDKNGKSIKTVYEKFVL
jgi:hypothetical protein